MGEALLIRRGSILHGLGIELVVNAPNGSLITVTNGTKILTNSITSNNPAIFNIPNYGEWTITGTLNNESDTKTIIMDTLMQYTVYLSYVHIYGISRDITSSSPEWNRTDEAIGKNATASIGITVIGESDFDDCYPWSGMVRETLDTGDIMVKIPKFYYQRYRDGNIEYIKIADGKIDGFKLHPAFFHSEKESECVYVSAYRNVGTSKANQSTVSYSISSGPSDMRTTISKKGSGWYLWDISLLSAIQMLCLVEFATYNIQSIIGIGITDYTSSITGACDGVANLTGRTTGTDGSVDIVYRGIESIYGSNRCNVDGITIYNNKYYYCNDPSKYVSDSITNYTVLSYSAPSSSGFIKTIGYDEQNDYLMLPATNGGSNSTYITDKIYRETTSYAALMYGAGNSSDQTYGAGLFCYNFAYTASTGTDRTNKTMFIPQ